MEDTSNDQESRVTLNGTSMLREDFDKKKQELEKKNGVKVIKTGNDEYKSKIKG
jgi:hypothetical protein